MRGELGLVGLSGLQVGKFTSLGGLVGLIWFGGLQVYKFTGLQVY